MRVFSKCKICDNCRRYRYRLRRATRNVPVKKSSRLIIPGQFADTRNQLYYLSLNKNTEDCLSKAPSEEEIEEEKPVCSKTIKKQKKPKKEKKVKDKPSSVVDCIANYYKSTRL